MMCFLYCILFDDYLFLLYTEPRLSVWMIVIICSITAIVILLILIFVCIAYRRRQVQLNHPYSFVLDHTGLVAWQ